MRHAEIPRIRFVSRDEWYLLLERAHLHPSTKNVAMAMARFANPRSGRFIFPGEVRLAGAMQRKERHVREHLALLRELEILTRVRHNAGQKGVFDEYWLTWPLDDALLQWRIDGHPPVKLRDIRAERKRLREKEQN